MGAFRGPARPASADFAGGVPGGLADNQATDVAARQERTIGIRPDKGTTQFAVCEHVIVTVIGKTRVKELQRLHADASDELGGWYLVARKAAWKNPIDVRGDFKDADQVGKMLVFSGAMGACSPKQYPR